MQELSKTGECKYKDELGNLCLAESFVNEAGDVSVVKTTLEQPIENISLATVESVSELVKYDNFYIKAPVQMLGVPIPLNDFLYGDTYMTIPEYLAKNNRLEVKDFTKDGLFFIKGFSFNLEGLDALREKLVEFGLELGVNIWILSPNEAREELQTWSN